MSSSASSHSHETSHGTSCPLRRFSFCLLYVYKRTRERITLGREYVTRIHDIVHDVNPSSSPWTCPIPRMYKWPRQPNSQQNYIDFWTDSGQCWTPSWWSSISTSLFLMLLALPFVLDSPLATLTNWQYRCCSCSFALLQWEIFSSLVWLPQVRKRSELQGVYQEWDRECWFYSRISYCKEFSRIRQSLLSNVLS